MRYRCQLVKMSERGANLLEFALVLPVFLLLLFGMVEFGLVLMKQSEMTSATREGARFGIILTDPRPTEATIKGKVCDAMGVTASNSKRAACLNEVTVDGEGGSYGSFLTVTMRSPYTSLFYGQLFSALGRTITLKASTTMVNE